MSSYREILRTTALFSGLRIVTIFVNIGTSKLIAFFLGAVGIGFYGILNSILALATSIADLGVSKSSIRSISEARGDGDDDKIIDRVSLVSKLIFVTGTFGGLITILLSYYISIWTFGEPTYWFSIVLIGMAVFFTVVKNGQAAIFQGLRKFKFITKNTIISSVLGFLASIPLIYFLGKDGVLYAILATAAIGFIVSKYYINRLKHRVKERKIHLTIENSKEIIVLGLLMMLVSFLIALSGYLIRAYISVNGSLKEVGYFQAGYQIISGYFGIIFMSMATDYFPRISAINKDNMKLEKEVNQQGVITLLLICPLVVILPYIMPYVISLLYTSEFTSTVDYVNIALFGIVFLAIDQSMGMILLAKNKMKVYIFYVLALQLFSLANNIIFFNIKGISGMGAAYSLNMFINAIVIMAIIYWYCKIKFNKHFLLTLLIVLGFATIAFFTKDLSGYLKCVVAIALVTSSVVFTTYRMKKLLNIKSISSLLNKKRNELFVKHNYSNKG